MIGKGGHAAVIREALCGRPLIGEFVAIGNNSVRKREAEAYRQAQDTTDAIFDTIIHPSAVVSPSAKIGYGTVIMAGAVVQAGAIIGAHCIVNSGATVDHHCVLGDYVHIAPGAHLCGCVEVGEGAWVGAGAICVQGAKVEPWVLIKAGHVHKSPDWSDRCQRLAHTE